MGWAIFCGVFADLSSLLWCVTVIFPAFWDLLSKALVTPLFAASMSSSDRRDELPLECTSLLINLSIAIAAQPRVQLTKTLAMEI